MGMKKEARMECNPNETSWENNFIVEALDGTYAGKESLATALIKLSLEAK